MTEQYNVHLDLY